MAQFFALEDTVRLIGRKFDKLERKSTATMVLKLAGRCEAPVIVERQARPRKVLVGSDREWNPITESQPGHVIFLDMEVPCRRCLPCRRARAAHWRHRIISELSGSHRTWFLTLTLSDHEQWQAIAMASQLAAKSSRSFSACSDDEKQRLLIRAVSPELTRYWKRIRKNSGAKCKFIWVAEFESSGERGSWNLHFHALVHEISPEQPIRKAVLKAAWRLGFSMAKLVDEPQKAAGYLCKYVTKSLGAGIRASHRYGAFS